jgi:hypothetical protein
MVQPFATIVVKECGKEFGVFFLGAARKAH